MRNGTYPVVKSVVAEGRQMGLKQANQTSGRAMEICRNAASVFAFKKFSSEKTKKNKTIHFHCSPLNCTSVYNQYNTLATKLRKSSLQDQKEAAA